MTIASYYPTHDPPVTQTRQQPVTGDVFGTFVCEVLTPPGTLTSLVLPGWEVRLWPVARLGDATLEARPLLARLGQGDLRLSLLDAGLTPLGPIRERRGSA